MPPDPLLVQRLTQIDRATTWRPAGTIPVAFDTHHPQGMVKIGDAFFVSSVDVVRYGARYPEPRDGHDRDTGEGVGHLFRIGPDGALRGDLVLGEGSIYHPGGIDYDGQFLWVPVAEYRPDSRAMIYKVDPRTMQAVEVLRVADHIGAVAVDKAAGLLHGLSWGGRKIYTWRLNAPKAKPTVVPNPTSYVDYQDCHHLGGRLMLCSGLAGYRASPTQGLALGGWELVNLRDYRPVWQAPIQLWTPNGRSMAQNPFFAETTTDGVRAYFMPDDNRSTIFMFETTEK